YQCKHCTFSTNFHSVIEQHISTNHSQDRELMCPYCKVKLVDNDHIMSHYNTH
ncbi:hypothetical protein CAPTEDRAFT_72383, partial [Capitella teleta]